MADEKKPEAVIPSAPPTGANPAATPQHRPVPGGDAPATAAAAAATGAVPRAAAPRPPAAAAPDLAGRTTTIASQGGAAAAKAAPAPAVAKTRDADDTSPLLTRRVWIGLAWGSFAAASAA